MQAQIEVFPEPRGEELAPEGEDYVSWVTMRRPPLVSFRMPADYIRPDAQQLVFDDMVTLTVLDRMQYFYSPQMQGVDGPRQLLIVATSRASASELREKLGRFHYVTLKPV